MRFLMPLLLLLHAVYRRPLLLYQQQQQQQQNENKKWAEIAAAFETSVPHYPATRCPLLLLRVLCYCCEVVFTPLHT